MSSYACPCGCDLKLSAGQQLLERRLLANVGPADQTPVWVTPGPQAVIQRPEAPEPTETVMCRSCGRKYELACYLAAFLRLRSAPVPDCDACTGRATA